MMVVVDNDRDRTVRVPEKARGEVIHPSHMTQPDTTSGWKSFTDRVTVSPSGIQEQERSWNITAHPIGFIFFWKVRCMPSKSTHLIETKPNQYGYHLETIPDLKLTVLQYRMNLFTINCSRDQHFPTFFDRNLLLIQR